MVWRQTIQRSEEGHALDMIPVEVRDEHVREDCLAVRRALQMPAQHSKARSAVEDVEAVAEPHLDTGGVASVAHVPGLRSGRRTAHSPELDPHPMTCVSFGESSSSDVTGCQSI